MENLKKMFEAVELQLVIIVVLGIINIAISHTIYSDVVTLDQLLAASTSPLAMVSLVFGLLSLVVTAWAGYVWVKESKGTAVDGGKAGALVSAISGIITGALSAIYITPIMDRLYSAAGVPGMAGTGLAAVSFVIGIVVAAVIGFILGLIGGAFGKGK